MTLSRAAIPSPNYSSRGGMGVRLIVLHTAEGARSYQELGNFFANPASGVSSHVGIDDTPGIIGEYVRRDGKAWTQGNANPYCVAAELCAFAEWSPEEWAMHPVMLDNAAAWVAEEAAAFGIPLVALTAAQAQGGVAGVCQHVDLGSHGGGHWDCGPGFPMAQVIAAAGGVAAAPSPPPTPAGAAPPWPGVYLSDYSDDPSVFTWQEQMQARGWAIAVDGGYGPQSAWICQLFQDEKGLAVDGVVGPDTWAATWESPVT